jgi:hypothetical protein
MGGTRPLLLVSMPRTTSESEFSPLALCNASVADNVSVASSEPWVERQTLVQRLTAMPLPRGVCWVSAMLPLESCNWIANADHHGSYFADVTEFWVYSLESSMAAQTLIRRKVLAAADLILNPKHQQQNRSACKDIYTFHHRRIFSSCSPQDIIRSPMSLVTIVSTGHVWTCTAARLQPTAQVPYASRFRLQTPQPQPSHSPGSRSSAHSHHCTSTEQPGQHGNNSDRSTERSQSVISNLVTQKRSEGFIHFTPVATPKTEETV